MYIEHPTSNIRRRTLTAVVLFVCAALCANADTASRLYEQGRYNEAFEQFKKAAANQKDNWPLFYDLGVAAYKAGRPDEAAKAFERAVSSFDKTLQAKSLYNLGNSYYRIGEWAEQQKPEQALPVYERSLKSYEGTVALDPTDADAKHNVDVVKKKIEELKKKQQQQDQQKKPKGDDQGKSEKRDPDKPQSDMKPDQNDQPSNMQKPTDSQKPEDKQQKNDPSKQEAPNQNAQKDPPNQPPQVGPTNNFEQMQAQVLLDNLREEEKNWNFFPELQMNLKDASEPAKDW